MIVGSGRPVASTTRPRSVSASCAASVCALLDVEIGDERARGAHVLSLAKAFLLAVLFVKWPREAVGRDENVVAAFGFALRQRQHFGQAADRLVIKHHRLVGGDERHRPCHAVRLDDGEKKQRAGVVRQDGKDSCLGGVLRVVEGERRVFRSGPVLGEDRACYHFFEVYVHRSASM